MWPPAARQLSVQFRPPAGGGGCIDGLKIVRTPDVQSLWRRCGRRGSKRVEGGHESRSRTNSAPLRRDTVYISSSVILCLLMGSARGGWRSFLAPSMLPTHFLAKRRLDPGTTLLRKSGQRQRRMAMEQCTSGAMPGSVCPACPADATNGV